MIIIAGLGNPDKKYDKTRHNAGFDAIDVLADKLGIKVKEKKFKAYVGEGFIGTTKVLLMKPQTYMNLSGEAIAEAVNFYKLDPQTDVVVICDDINLVTGSLRIRSKGSAGGHNGLKNIIACTGTEGFTRVRVGVGDSFKEGALIEHVLGKFSKDDRKLLEQALEDCASAVELIASGNIEQAMNLYNRKKEAPENK